MNTVVSQDDLELETRMREQLNGLKPISPSCCIYRVPSNVRRVNENVYTPLVVSVGPLHHRRKELQRWEDIKLHYLQAFLRRTNITLDDCIKVVRQWEEAARNCYSERIDLSSNEFVKMMLVDSCLVIEIMLRLRLVVEETEYLSKLMLTLEIQEDLIKLENQLPFFVLHGIFRLGFGHLAEDYFISLSLRFFHNMLLTEETFEHVKRHLASGYNIKHLLDLLRLCHLASNPRVESTSGTFLRIPSASVLHEAGMKFRIRKSICSPLDMQYNAGLLEIPQIRVTHDAEYLLSNLAALEYCQYPSDTYIIDYVTFMDALLDNAKDVDLLIHNGIIENWLVSNVAVASLVNSLKTGNYLTSPYYFSKISRDMKAYANDPCHKWKATFKRDYCSTPWMIASTVAAIILLSLTLIQTIFSAI